MTKVGQGGIREAQVRLPVKPGHPSEEKGGRGDRPRWVTHMGRRTSSEGVCLPSSEAFSIPSKRTKEHENRPSPKVTSYYSRYGFNLWIHRTWGHLSEGRGVIFPNRQDRSFFSSLNFNLRQQN